MMFNRVVFGLALLTFIEGAALAQTSQQLSPDQSALVADFSGAAGSLQSTSAAFDHMRAELKSVIEAQQKEAAELIYWRQYFAGLPAPVAKAADIKQLPASVTPK